MSRWLKLLVGTTICLVTWILVTGALSQAEAIFHGAAQARATTPETAWMVAASKKIRVIIDSDAANESDDQVVIAHALLSPAFEIHGLVAAHFRPHSASPVATVAESMEASYREMHDLLDVMGVPGCVPIVRGAAGPMADSGEMTGSDGAAFIIREALRNDPRPLFVVFLGPLTDLAIAYRKEPRIAEHLTAVWIGGGAYPDGGMEYNQDGDRIAANAVMESRIPLWQIPRPDYRLARFGMAEVNEKIGRQGKLGAFLFDRIRRFVERFPPLTEFFQFSDEPAVAVLLRFWGAGSFEQRAAPTITEDGYYVHTNENRPIRVYRSFDHRTILEDLFAKLAAFSSGTMRPGCKGSAVE